MKVLKTTQQNLDSLTQRVYKEWMKSLNGWHWIFKKTDELLASGLTEKMADLGG